ncbi:unnamed protein product [Protopolystoma xenopodis]|uniref:Uncharacterized protein n=1 Tax=Protopolystoma xenopodis TaxID=117903 RepID=A0A3S5CJ33_9PLAT|nr:unnamed protein product [Protopolystoma xenopodis]
MKVLVFCLALLPLLVASQQANVLSCSNGVVQLLHELKLANKKTSAFTKTGIKSMFCKTKCYIILAQNLTGYEMNCKTYSALAFIPSNTAMVTSGLF